MGTLHYFWAAPRLVLNGPAAYAALALILLTGVGVWIHFVVKSWGTLGAPLSPDSTPTTDLVSSPAAPTDALRVGSQPS